jgi:hypothetical protein
MRPQKPCLWEFKSPRAYQSPAYANGKAAKLKPSCMEIRVLLRAPTKRACGAWLTYRHLKRTGIGFNSRHAHQFLVASKMESVRLVAPGERCGFRTAEKASSRALSSEAEQGSYKAQVGISKFPARTNSAAVVWPIESGRRVLVQFARLAFLHWLLLRLLIAFEIA